MTYYELAKDLTPSADAAWDRARGMFRTQDSYLCSYVVKRISKKYRVETSLVWFTLKDEFGMARGGGCVMSRSEANWLEYIIADRCARAWEQFGNVKTEPEEILSANEKEPELLSANEKEPDEDGLEQSEDESPKSTVQLYDVILCFRDVDDLQNMMNISPDRYWTEEYFLDYQQRHGSLYLRDFLRMEHPNYSEKEYARCLEDVTSWHFAEAHDGSDDDEVYMTGPAPEYENPEAAPTEEPHMPEHPTAGDQDRVPSCIADCGTDDLLTFFEILSEIGSETTVARVSDWILQMLAGRNWNGVNAWKTCNGNPYDLYKYMKL